MVTPRYAPMGRPLPQSFNATMGEMRADYTAAKQSRFQKQRRVIQSGSGPDWHYRTQHDFLKIVEYAGDIDRNDVIMGSITDRSVHNTIQGGFKLDFDTGDQNFDADLAGGWSNYADVADNFDIAGEETFSDLQSKLYRSAKVAGDIWAVGTDSGHQQIFEAYRVRTPTRTKRNIFQGVELDAFRKPLKVWVTNEDLQFDMTQTLISDYTPCSVRDGNGVRRVMQVHPGTKKRTKQTRGISAYAPIFDLVGMHDDIQFAAVLKQQLQNALIFFKERTKDFAGGPEEALGKAYTVNREDGSVETVENLGPGTMIKGKVGETIKGFQSTVQAGDLYTHVKMILTLMGVNLGLPLIFVLMDGSETNFSGWRGAFDQAKLGFRENQRQMERQYCTPTLRLHLAIRSLLEPGFAKKLEEIRLACRAKGRQWFKWHHPTWPYVNPLDDRNADLVAVSNYQEAPSTNMARNGLEFERETRRGITDRANAIEWAFMAADQLNKKMQAAGITNQPTVVWEQLYTPPQPKFVHLNRTEDVNADDGTEKNVVKSRMR